MDGRENERMNKTREMKLETDIAVGQRGGCESQRQRHIVRGKSKGKKSR